MRHKFKIFVVVSLILLAISTYNFNVVQANNEKIDNILSTDFDLNKDAKAEFRFQLYNNTSGITYKAQTPVTSEFKYMKSTSYKYIQSMGNKEIGYIDLVIDSFLEDTSYMFFLNYYSEQSGINLKYDLITYCEKPDVNIISIRDVDNKCSVNKVAAGASGSLANEIKYFESENRYLKFNKIVTTKKLGSSVYELKVSPTNSTYTKSQNEIKSSFCLNSVSKKEIKANWILSTEPMINWNDDFTYKTLLNMDYFGDTYFFHDGSYRKNMSNYVPRSDTAQTYFKNPSGLQVRACKWVLNKGSLFRVMGLYTMYSYAQSYNKLGYIPTQPMSEWLSKDYNIGYNFYDTRFNSDTMDSLLQIYKDYPDEYVLGQMNNYIKFYKNYYKTKQYKVGELIFVPDYMDITGKNKINPTSLNHFISETQVLFQYYKLTGDKECLSIAREMLNSIKLTCDKWIRPNGDLWYKITPDGKFVSNDYPLVTYNDLVYFSMVLKEIDGNVPKEIQKLLQSKTKWAKEKGYLIEK